MTTLSSNYENSKVANAEERLLNILNLIGKTRIPDLEVGDFYEDFVKSDGDCHEKLKPWEEQVGIRLSLRILDNIMVEQFQRQEEQHHLIDNLSKEKLTLENEVETLREQLSHLEQCSIESSQKSEALSKENLKLKDKLAILVKSYDQLVNELKLDQKVKMLLPVETEYNELEKFTFKSKKLFSRSRNPGQSISNSTQAHVEDKSFVPETLQILNLDKCANKRTLPVPKSNDLEFDMEISVPDTPEKSQLNPSDNIEVCLTPEKLSISTNYVNECPKSPLISRGIFPSKNKKLKVFHKSEVLKEINVFNGDTETIRRVGRINPSVQSEMDKKSFNDLNKDFQLEKVEQTPPKKVVKSHFPLDTDSDFESPNLLVLHRRNKNCKRNKENLVLKQDDNEVDKTLNRVTTNYEDEIDLFDSPSKHTQEELDVRKINLSPEGENRWGVGKGVKDKASGADKKTFGGKQAKIVGFFRNSPKISSSYGDFVRVNQADSDMEAAIRLSAEVSQAGANKGDTLNERNVNNEVFKVNDGNHDEVPKATFAHIGPTVRKKEERKKLFGFDCRECQEYYQQKLEEGQSKDQIIKILNKCSRHRGLFKPPRTPEKFWDADIVEDDPDDPRNKTQSGQVFRTRAVRREEARSKRKAFMSDN